jgi:hypothetical protein
VRLKEVEKIIKKANGLTAFEVASKMDWDLKYDCFDDFPMSQKWFATGEALSHLLYIENQKKIRRKGNKEGKILYL